MKSNRQIASNAKPRRRGPTATVETTLFELVATAQDLTGNDNEAVKLVGNLLQSGTVRRAQQSTRRTTGRLAA